MTSGNEICAFVRSAFRERGEVVYNCRFFSAIVAFAAKFLEDFGLHLLAVERRVVFKTSAGRAKDLLTGAVIRVSRKIAAVLTGRYVFKFRRHVDKYATLSTSYPPIFTTNGGLMLKFANSIAVD